MTARFRHAYEPSEKILAAALRAARGLADLNQEVAAKLYGVTRAQLINAESGRNPKEVAAKAQPALQGLNVSTEFTRRQTHVWRHGANANGKEATQTGLIRAAREASGLTQSQLADASSVSRRAIVAVEKTGDASDLIRAAILNALYRRRIATFVNKDECGITIIPDHVPLRPFADNGGPDEDMTTRIERSFSRDQIHPAFARYRIEIIGSDPQIWREFLIPENATFEDLHITIQAAFGWHNEHLHEFSAGLRIGPDELNHEGSYSDGNVFDERLVWLHDLPDHVEFEYHYDFGDNWRHRITRGDNEDANGRPCRPIILDGAGAGPVENSGGIEAFNALADKIRAHRLDSERSSWLKHCDYDGYKPDAVNLAEANAALAEHDFDIPATWVKQHERRSSIVVRAPHLDARAEREHAKKTTVLPVGAVKITAIERLGAEAFFESGGAAKTGSIHNSDSRRNRRIDATYRSDAVLNAIMYASDIDDYETLPLNVSYEIDGKRKTFAPDIKIQFKNGDVNFIHVLTEEDIPHIAEYQLLQEEMRGIGHTVVYIGAGAGDDPLNSNGYELNRHSLPSYGKPQPKEIIDFIQNLVADGKVINFADAVNAIVAAGHADKHENYRGGEPKYLASYRLLAAAQKNLISMDLSRPAEKSQIASTGFFDNRAKFKDFIARNCLFLKEQPFPRTKKRKK